MHKIYIYPVDDRLERLTSENAKLKELVADMWCSAMINCDFAERLAFTDEFGDRMRKLRIEVKNNAERY